MAVTGWVPGATWRSLGRLCAGFSNAPPVVAVGSWWPALYTFLPMRILSESGSPAKRFLKSYLKSWITKLAIVSMH